MAKKIKKKIKKKKIIAKKKTKKIIKKIVRIKKPVRKKPKRRIVKKIIKKEKPVKKPESQRGEIFDGVHKAKIRIIGIGGGGGSIVSEIISRIKKVDFLVANTDARALKGVNRKVKKIQFGQRLTNGLGTGMNPEIGEEAALEEKEKIKKIFEGQDLCIIVSCLGGGTSSGATPIFAKIAKSMGCLTFGIFTLPFQFEGEKKMEIAKQSLEKISPYFNVFSIIPNERIFQIIDKNTPLQSALSAINKRLISNLEGLLEMVYSSGLINIDFADLRTVLSGYGKLAYLNTVEIAETHKEEAARKVISTSLYPYTLKGARGILYNVVGGKGLCLSDVSRVSEIISESVNKNAKIIFGIIQEAKYKDKVKITLLATGCGSKNDLIKTKKAPVVVKKKMAVKKEIKKAPAPIMVPKPKNKKKPMPKSKPKLKKTAKENYPSKQIDFGGKVRRNALEVRKVMEQEEKDLLDKESVWDTPAILRKKE